MSQMTNSMIVDIDKLADDIFDIWVTCKDVSEFKAGQFVSVYSDDTAHLMPRPISVCEVDTNSDIIRLIYRTVGYATNEISKKKVGDRIRILGPLGNGFTLDQKAKSHILVGGGIGIFPLLQLAKNIHFTEKKDPVVVLGYRDANTFLRSEFEKYADVFVATEDGSVGIQGNVLDALKVLEAEENQIKNAAIYSCGPKIMLNAVKDFAVSHKINCYVSLEERMACGVGACLGCVCKSKDEDEYSKVKTKRICKDGPVFLAEEVEL